MRSSLQAGGTAPIILVGSQAGSFGMMVLKFLGVAGQRGFEARRVGAEFARGFGAGRARRGGGAGLREEAFFGG
jgi:hypothetical protein